MIELILMQRVEKSMDQQANAYSLFQTAITLEGQVRVRTEELKSALSRLERTNGSGQQGILIVRRHHVQHVEE